MSTVVMCYASDNIEYDRRKPEMSNAPLQMTQDKDNIEKNALEYQTQTYLHHRNEDCNRSLHSVGDAREVSFSLTMTMTTRILCLLLLSTNGV